MQTEGGGGEGGGGREGANKVLLVSHGLLFDQKKNGLCHYLPLSSK